jgi:type II secretory pathway component PulC
MLTQRKGLLALTTAALLITAATAQNGSRSEVRDPFVNNDSQPIPIQRHTPSQRDSGDPFQGKSTVTTATKKVDKPTVAPVVYEVPAPDVTVSGIVASSAGRQAILWTGSRSLIVSVGQQVADYRVKAIDANSVTFGAQGKSFKIPLGQES